MSQNDKAPLYTASIHYAHSDAPNEEHSTHIIFREWEGFQGAKRAVYRWWLDRHLNVPSYFHALYAIKIYAYEAHEIDAAGRLPPSIGMAALEWKCDHCPIETWLKRAL